MIAESGQKRSNELTRFKPGNRFGEGHGRQSTEAELERDTALLLAASVPFVGSKVGLWKWARNECGWSRGHYEAIRRRVDAIYAEQADETAEEVRKRLLRSIQEQLPRCQSYKIAQGPMGIGPVCVPDPDTGRPLIEVDHAAIQGYHKITMDLVGIGPKGEAAPPQHIHFHGDLAALPPAQLAERIAALKARRDALMAAANPPQPAPADPPT